MPTVTYSHYIDPVALEERVFVDDTLETGEWSVINKFDLEIEADIELVTMVPVEIRVYREYHEDGERMRECVFEREIEP